MLIGGRAHSLEDIEFIGDLGLKFAEISLLDPETSRAEMPELIRLKEQHHLSYLAHGPREGNPSDTESLRNTFLPTMCSLIDIAAQLKIKVVTVHFWLDRRFIDRDVFATKVDILEQMACHAESAGVALCIENLSEQSDHLAEAFRRIPQLYLTLDIGHAQILTQRNTSYDLIEKFGERLMHVHAHDNRGGNSPADDLHLPLGEGIIDFQSIFQTLHDAHYNRTVTIELARDHMRSAWETIEAVLARIRE